MRRRVDHAAWHAARHVARHPVGAVLVAGLIAGAAGAPGDARADSSPASTVPMVPEPASRRDDARPWSGDVGVGGYVALGGPTATGLCAVATLSPGGWADRTGLRLEARTAGDTAGDSDSDGDGDDGASRFDRGLFTAGLTYEAAASRPRLALSLHGEVGALAPDPHPALGGGVEIELWLLGPIALAAGSSAHLIVDGLDSQLVLAGTLGLRLAR